MQKMCSSIYGKTYGILAKYLLSDSKYGESLHTKFSLMWIYFSMKTQHHLNFQHTSDRIILPMVVVQSQYFRLHVRAEFVI